ncbi:MAG: pitrilysin family protein [Pseudomonadota bacterium]|nr:pitrilysin family protein [Pseudomonadota bacterium]
MNSRLGVFFIAAIVGLSCSDDVQGMEIRKVVSNKGVVAWFVPDKSVPLIAMNFVFRGAGSVTDPEGREGLAEMSSALLDEGAGEIRSADFQKKLEEIAAQLSFSVGRDHYSGRLRTLSANKDKAFNLLKLSLTSPRFDEKPVERIRGQLIASLRRNVENPRRILDRAWLETVFSGHPYSRPADGTENSLSTITQTDLRSFVSQRFTRDRLLIGVVGDISEAELKLRLDEVFSYLPQSGPTFYVSKATPAGPGRTVVIKKTIPQSVLTFGHVGIKREDPDWYAALLVTRIFGGGGFSSRLYEEIREKRGLAYSVYAYLRPMESSALIIGGVATQNSQAGESLRVVKREWDRLSKKGITKKELADAKTYSNGSFPLRMDSSRGLSKLLVGIQISNLGIDYIFKRPSLISDVTLEDANRVARRLYDVSKLTAVIVGEPEGIQSVR